MLYFKSAKNAVIPFLYCCGAVEKKFLFKKADQWIQGHGENNVSMEAGYIDKFWSKAEIERNFVPVSRSVSPSFSYLDMCVDIAFVPSFFMYLETTSTRSTPGWGENAIILAIKKWFIEKAGFGRKNKNSL